MKNERRATVPSYQAPGGTTQPRAAAPVRALPEPDGKPAGKPPGRPARESATGDDVTVSTRLNRALLAKLDRLCRKHSGGLTTTKRSTLLRWLIEREPE